MSMSTDDDDMLDDAELSGTTDVLDGAVNDVQSLHLLPCSSSNRGLLKCLKWVSLRCLLSLNVVVV